MTYKRTDTTQKPIVQALRKAGATVIHLHMVGKGCPDAIVGFRGKSWLMEFKSKGGKLTKDQTETFAKWQGEKPYVVDSVDQALYIIGCGPPTDYPDNSRDETKQEGISEY